MNHSSLLLPKKEAKNGFVGPKSAIHRSGKGVFWIEIRIIADWGTRNDSLSNKSQ